MDLTEERDDGIRYLPACDVALTVYPAASKRTVAATIIVDEERS
jgi:hypothetical protein